MHLTLDIGGIYLLGIDICLSFDIFILAYSFGKSTIINTKIIRVQCRMNKSLEHIYFRIIKNIAQKR